MRYFLMLIPAIALAGQAHWSVIDGTITKLESFGGSVSGVEYVHDIPLRDGEVRHGADWLPQIVTNCVETVREVPPGLAMVAMTYYGVMDRHFFPGAATNHALSRDQVSGYFIQKWQAQAMTDDDTRDALFLLEIYPKLLEFTGEETAHGFPFGKTAVTTTTTTVTFEEPDP